MGGCGRGKNYLEKRKSHVMNREEKIESGDKNGQEGKKKGKI